MIQSKQVDMKKRRIFPIVLMAAILLQGCGFADRYARGMFTNQDTELPLFMDDFSDHDNGWILTVAEQGVVHYDGDALRILINEPNATYWATPGLKITDSVVDVDATKVTGPDDNLFGLVCRFQDERNFYGFLLSSDGYFGIMKVEDGQRTILGQPAMQVTDLVQKAGKVNHLRADCVDDRLSLYLNWTKLTEVTDTTFNSGDVGILGMTRETIGTDVRFDNFIVIAPE